MQMRQLAVLRLMAAVFLLFGPGVDMASASPVDPAATEYEPTISGTLRNSAADNAPVPGVTITVTTPDGEEVATATTDEEGKYTLEVPEPGRYQVGLEEDTLPEGVEMRPGARNPVTVTVSSSGGAAPVFAIGPDTRDVATWVDRLPQTIFDGLYFGAILALGALGLSVIFGTTGLTNFAHGELIAFGAIVAYFLDQAGLPLILAGVLAVAISGVFGFVQDAVLWRPLRRRGTGLIAMMIVSIGLALLLRNIYQIRTGGRTETYSEYVTPSSLDLGFFTASARDLVTLVIGAIALVIVSVALLRTRIGKATRAVADNPALAASTGINVNRVISVVWTVGAALAGMCGFILAMSIQVNYQMGQLLLLLVFAAVTLGGLGTVWGAMLGALVVGIFIEVSTLAIPAELKNAGALAVLILILLVRPQGILGRRERIG